MNMTNHLDFRIILDKWVIWIIMNYTSPNAIMVNNTTTDNPIKMYNINIGQYRDYCYKP